MFYYLDENQHSGQMATHSVVHSLAELRKWEYSCKKAVRG